MMTNELLLEKSKTQKRLDDIAHHSLVNGSDSFRTPDQTVRTSRAD